MAVCTRSAFVAAALASLLGPSAHHQLRAQESPAGAVELRPGVVIDPQRQVAYVMNPKGGIDALRLVRGAVVWHTDQAARPLASTGDTLVAQAEVRTPGNELHLRMLDPLTGRARQTVTHALPRGVRATVVDTVETIFSIDALATRTEALLEWEFVERPMQGVRPGALDVDAPPPDRAGVAAAPQPAPAEPLTGVVRIELPGGKAADAPPGARSPSAVRQAAAAASQAPAITGEQHLSADGRHVLTSERVADDSVWEKYEWAVFERATGRRVGTVRDYRSHAPFIVVGSTLFTDIGPFERRTDAGLVSQPLSLRARDLAKGVTLWTREIRDTEYRGPFPG